MKLSLDIFSSSKLFNEELITPAFRIKNTQPQSRKFNVLSKFNWGNMCNSKLWSFIYINRLDGWATCRGASSPAGWYLEGAINRPALNFGLTTVLCFLHTHKTCTLTLPVSSVLFKETRQGNPLSQYKIIAKRGKLINTPWPTPHLECINWRNIQLQLSSRLSAGYFKVIGEIPSVDEFFI